ncbi:MAG TPA: tetratricopeptide repeat protein [Usitatibacter sp.]|nr:tetratricopeptide repeat protein [Usitatibacter sp.]
MPNDAKNLDATLSRALDLEREGRTAEALEAFAECLAIAPTHARTHHHAAMASVKLDDWAKAIAHLRVAVAAAPQVAEGWMYLASALHRVGHVDDADRLARQALAMKTGLSGAWNTLGLVALDRGRHEEALTHFQHALAIEPGLAPARMNIGCCEHAVGRDDEAIASFNAALALDPSLAAARYNLGALHHKRGRYAEAIRHYREAIALRPTDEQPHFNLALALFSTGLFEEGWNEYAWRPERRELASVVRRQGVARAAIHGEQGLGDVLFFLRFAAALRERGTTLDFVGDARLHPMLARTGLFAALATRLEELDAASRDVILAGDLPTPSAQTPPPLTLTADPKRLAALRERLSALGPGPYIALAWRSGQPKSGRIDNLYKEVPLDLLGKALRAAKATWISVQRDPKPGEIETLGRAIGAQVHDFSGVNADLEEALALLAAVDEYVGVSSTLVHLHAGVGGRARVVVPFPYEWRWMESGETSPWFPRAAIYRQAADGDWGAALDRLARDLGPTNR